MEINSNINIKIPNKRYFTIGEVSKIYDIKSHVLRYWEQEFKQLEPIKRRGNRRYYQQKDLMLVSQIHDLLHKQGYTIEGAKNKLNETMAINNTFLDRQIIEQLSSDLEKILSILKR